MARAGRWRKLGLVLHITSSVGWLGAAAAVAALAVAGLAWAGEPAWQFASLAASEVVTRRAVFPLAAAALLSLSGLLQSWTAPHAPGGSGQPAGGHRLSPPGPAGRRQGTGARTAPRRNGVGKAAHRSTAVLTPMVACRGAGVFPRRQPGATRWRGLPNRPRLPSLPACGQVQPQPAQAAPSFGPAPPPPGAYRQTREVPAPAARAPTPGRQEPLRAQRVRGNPGRSWRGGAFPAMATAS